MSMRGIKRNGTILMKGIQVNSTKKGLNEIGSDVQCRGYELGVWKWSKTKLEWKCHIWILGTNSEGGMMSLMMISMEILENKSQKALD